MVFLLRVIARQFLDELRGKIPLTLFGTSSTDYELCIRSICHHKTFLEPEGVHNIYFHVENLKCTFEKNIILGYNQFTYRCQTIFCIVSAGL